MLQFGLMKTSRTEWDSFLVSVPPRISSRDLETDLVVRENENLTLSCDADGHPKPLVVWRREDGEPITVHGSKG